MPEVVVIGGGFAGCAAAAAVARAGVSVTLLERMEVLGGCGLWAGMIDYESFPVMEELKLMGADDIFQVIDNCTLHTNVKFKMPKPSGATKTIYDTTRLDPELQNHLKAAGVKVRLQARAKDVKMDGAKIRLVILDDGTEIPGDVFVDATGGAGPIDKCQKYGNGCPMCFWRCPAFGGRVSIAAKAGVKELMGKKPDGSFGPGTAAYSLLKESLTPELRKELEETGRKYIPVPPELINEQRTKDITASVNADEGFAQNVVLVDIGSHAKRIAAGWTPLSELRKIPGLERVIYGDPYAGTIGNAVRYMAITPRGSALNVPGVDNLFVASEKVGTNGIVSSIITGIVAGHNAARKAADIALLKIPETTLLGDFLAYVNKNWNTEEGLRARFCTHEETYLNRVRELGLYTKDKDKIRSRIKESGLLSVFSQRVNL